MIRSFGRVQLRWSVAPVALALFVVSACGSDGEADVQPTPTDPGALQTQVASYVATKTEVDRQVADSVSATIAAQTPTVTPEPLGSPIGEDDDAPTSTPDSEPTASPTEVVVVPTATPQPPQATATPPPPAPSPTPIPPTATPSPTPVPPTPTPSPTPAPPATLYFEQPDSGHHSLSGEHLSFAQGAASFDVAQFPANAFIRSGVYFGLGEDVSSAGIIKTYFVAEQTGTVRITADASWNGVLRTHGWGSMYSSFELKLGVFGADGVPLQAPFQAGGAQITSDTASKPVSGNSELVFEGRVEAGYGYTIQLIATCESSGSDNIWASDTECIFDDTTDDDGYVQWRSLTVEYLP